MPCAARQTDVTKNRKDTIADQWIDEVVITVARKNTQLLPDRIVYTPEASVIQETGTLYDMLAALPGVTVEQDGRLTLNTQAGVRLLMDGKEIYLSGEELTSLLKATPATQTDKIEIMTMPSAAYDAAGMGIIDIRTKKMKQRGVNANLDGNYTFGRFGGGYGSLSMNRRFNGLNTFLAYSYFMGKSAAGLSIDRDYTGGTGRMVQESWRRRDNHAHNLRSGMDYHANEHTTLGLSFGGNFSGWRERAEMEASIRNGGELATTQSRMNSDWNRMTAGLSVEHHLKRDGGEISASADWLRYDRDESQHLNSNKPDTLRSDTEGKINLLIVSADAVVPTDGRWKWSGGVKLSVADIDNEAGYLHPSPSGREANDGHGSHFIYKEHNGAIYIQSGYEHRGLTITAGLRMEHTWRHGVSCGNTTQPDSSFTRRETCLFPSLAVQQGWPSGNALRFTYSRRITRPNYGDLNPFVYIFDDYTYESGNTRLRASFSDRLELVYVHRGHLQAALFLSREDAAISKSYQEREQQRVYVMPENVAHYTQAGLRLHATGINLLPWWTMNMTIMGLYNRFRYYDSGKGVTNVHLTPMLNCTNRMALPHGWTAELSVDYTGHMAYGQATVHPQADVKVGISKNILRDRGTVSLFARDIFNSTAQKVDLLVSGRKAYFVERSYRQAVGIGFSWRFCSGDNSKEIGKERVSDEIKRVNL